MGRAAILRAASDASSPLRGSSPSERSTSGECQRGSGVQAMRREPTRVLVLLFNDLEQAHPAKPTPAVLRAAAAANRWSDSSAAVHPGRAKAWCWWPSLIKPASRILLHDPSVAR